jgi:tetratricopeptide (TPR) repeat protein
MESMKREKWSCFLVVFLLSMFMGIAHAQETQLAGKDLLEKGIAEYKAENFEEALVTFTEARAKKNDSSVAAFYLGLTYKQVGDYKNAAKNFKDAVTLTPTVKDAHTELIEVLYNMNETKEAREWLEKAEKQGINPPYLAFLKGLIYLKENNNKEAVIAFKKAKELDIKLAQPADFQIAIAYAKDRRLKDARNSLKAVTAIDPTSEIATFAKEYESALTKTLDAYKKWHFMVGAAYQYDDNVVAKPSTSIPGVEISNEADDSVIGTLKIEYAPLPDGPWFFNGQYNLYSNNHFSKYTHDIMSHTLTLMPGYNLEKGAITLPVSYNYVLLNEQQYVGLITIKPTFNLMLTSSSIAQISVGYGKRDMLKPALMADEKRDGDIYSASVAYILPFSQGRGMASLKYEYTKEDTQGVNWDSKTDRVNLGILVPLTYSLKLTLSGDALVNKFDTVHTVFGVTREDKIYSGAVGVTYEMVKGLNLNLQYSYTRSDSNIAVYDYDRNVYMAGLEYNF